MVGHTQTRAMHGCMPMCYRTQPVEMYKTVLTETRLACFSSTGSAGCTYEDEKIIHCTRQISRHCAMRCVHCLELLEIVSIGVYRSKFHETIIHVVAIDA